MRLGNKKFTDSRWLSEKERKVVYKLPQSALCFNEYAILSVSPDDVTATISKWDKVLTIDLTNGEIRFPDLPSERIYLDCKTLYVS
jgi:hypothetical protein